VIELAAATELADRDGSGLLQPVEQHAVPPLGVPVFPGEIAEVRAQPRGQAGAAAPIPVHTILRLDRDAVGRRAPDDDRGLLPTAQHRGLHPEVHRLRASGQPGGMGWDTAPDESDTSEEGDRVGELRGEK
jgi:hypothetical protein